MITKLSHLPIIYFQTGFSILLVIIYFIGTLFVKKAIHSRAKKNKFDISRQKYTTKFFNFIWALVILTVIAIVWDISFKGLSIYVASVFTVIGVAFFAQWSILSNITAAIILFFNYSFKIGNDIQIIDGENSVTGKIVDIHPFHIQIKTKDDELVSYPNNLIIQKPIILIKKDDSKQMEDKR
jgi:small-conductance mechanosensitive channel